MLAAVDTPPDARVAAHLAECQRCTEDLSRLEGIRRELRFEGLEGAPDVMPGLRRRLGRRPRWHAARLAPAAAFVLAFCTGALAVGVRGVPPVTAEDLPARVLAAQEALAALDAELEIVERGWHDAVPERRFAGRIRYRAPERLWLELEDLTDYPGPEWVPNDVQIVIDEHRSWSEGPLACPREALPACMPRQPRVRVMEGREPFPEAAQSPLDLVVPVQSFHRASDPEVVGTRRIAGRHAIGAEVTAAQLQPLLDGLRSAGAWRDIFPTDPAHLWMDAQTMVPLGVEVFPGADPERGLWEARHGYRDRAGQPYFAVEVTSLAEPAEWASPRAPTTGTVRQSGFRDQSLAPPASLHVPAGMRPYRTGIVGGGQDPRVEVFTWTDGRAWLKVRMTEDWAGGRLFGDLGPVVRMFSVEGVGHLYADEGGRKVAVHGPRRDAVVTGSVEEAVLARVAAGLGITGLPVPEGWQEHSSGDPASVSRLGFLTPDGLAGFGPPAVRREGDKLTLSYAGPGSRGFLLHQRPGTGLSPPLDPGARGVEVRGTVGRFSPMAGELEWVEAGRIIALRSRTLALPELLAVAEALR